MCHAHVAQLGGDCATGVVEQQHVGGLQVKVPRALPVQVHKAAHHTPQNAEQACDNTLRRGVVHSQEERHISNTYNAHSNNTAGACMAADSNTQEHSKVACSF